MQIQVNADAHMDGREAIVRHVEAEVTTLLDRFSDQITRVEVHLSDQSGSKPGGGAGKRCLIEARLAGREPAVATHDGATQEKAFEGAARKLQRLLTSSLGRSHDYKGAASIRAGEDNE
ncbi:MAG: HPF/RaiA family ribosome-associated protein [Pseudomonadota bacterium]